MPSQSTQLLLEGPDIESLLVRVREEYGPGVHIVSADKVRRGGVLGFFAREHYAMTIELDAEALSTLGPAASALPASALPAVVPALPASARSLADIAAAIDAAEAAFAAPAATAATLPGPGGLLGSRYGAGTRTAAEPPHDGAPTPSGSSDDAPLSTQGPDFATMLAGLARAAGPDDTLAPVVRAFVPARVPARVIDLPPVEAPVEEESVDTDATDAVAVPERLQVLGGRLTGVGTPPHITAAVLRELGARIATRRDETLSSGRPDADALDVLTRAVDAVLPDPPRLAGVAGDVLAVVGEGAAAYEFARTMARRLRLDPADVLLAAPSDLGTGVTAARRVSGPAEARRRGTKLTRTDVPSIVAVDLPFEPDAAAWAREVLDALGVRTVWAIVDATRKPADVDRQLDGVGRIDALVVRGTTSTGDPGSCLGLALGRGLPTPFLDGRRGDAAGWASLLLERAA